MTEIHHIILKVLANSASIEEQSMLEIWIEENPENKASFELQRKQWEDTLLVVEEEDKKRVFSNLKNRIREDKRTKLIDINRNVGKKKSWSWMKVAASVVGFIGIGSLTFYEISDPFSHLNMIGYELVQADAGTQQAQLLADGSTVYLNGDTKLKYKMGAEMNQRNLYLEGEAFDVARDVTKPFIIGMDNSQVKVLGTSFNIKAYPEDKKIETSVKTGRVSFNRAKSESLILIPGNKGVIDKDEKGISKLSVDNSLDLAWMSRTLLFENTQLSELAKTLYRTYGVKVKFTDGSLKNLKITAEFENEKLEEILKILGMTNEFSYSIDGDEVVIGQIGEF